MFFLQFPIVRFNFWHYAQSLSNFSFILKLIMFMSAKEITQAIFAQGCDSWQQKRGLVQPSFLVQIIS